MRKKQIILSIIIVILITIILALTTYIIIDKKVLDNKKGSNNEIIDKKNATTNEQSNNKDNDNKNDNNGEIIDKENDVTNEQDNNNFDIKYANEEKTFKNDDGKVIFINKRNIIDITNEKNDSIASKIEKFLNDISDADWNSLTKQTEEYSYVNRDEPCGVSYKFSTVKLNKNYISIKYDTSGDLGGISWHNTNGYVFDTKTGNALSLNDIVNDSNTFLNIVYNKVLEKYNKENLRDDWKNFIIKTGSWYFDNDGLVIYPIFDTTSFRGSTVSFSYNEINSFLLDKYKI